ncbi:hypothetical protein ACPOL_5129 [Acidisarcina polymorpha]|uniref:Uncharacterized protein n=1 Tax=Acidisarcina polymorpha TaxID=2211140 RepID=A0A2Z5G581_9BACT|nr:hypothetical protein [Acidisarcina polymorpha]AXC14383.1 hypothetical protein ACPOL_5129 [Acidisarcina polymorpha]
MTKPMNAIRRAKPIQGQLLSVTGLLLLLAILSSALSGCAVKLIGDYDETFDKGVTDIEQKAELYFAKLKSTPDTPFDQAFYDDITARLAVLKARAVAMPKYDILVQQITNLQSQFDDFHQLDKSAGRPISAAIVSSAQSGISVSFESILKLEIALKRTGTTSKAALAPATQK